MLSCLPLGQHGVDILEVCITFITLALYRKAVTSMFSTAIITLSKYLIHSINSIPQKFSAKGTCV